VRSKVYETVGRSSVRLSHHSPGGFAAERRARKRYRSTAAGAEQQQRHSTARSSKLRSAANASSVTLTAHVGC